MTDQRKVVYAEFTAIPGKEDALEELVRGYAELVRTEPGNLVFAASRKQDDPSAFFVYEEYADSEAFTAHVGSEYGANFNGALADLIVGETSDLTFLIPV